MLLIKGEIIPIVIIVEFVISYYGIITKPIMRKLVISCKRLLKIMVKNVTPEFVESFHFYLTYFIILNIIHMFTSDTNCILLSKFCFCMDDDDPVAIIRINRAEKTIIVPSSSNLKIVLLKEKES